MKLQKTIHWFVFILKTLPFRLNQRIRLIRSNTVREIYYSLRPLLANTSYISSILQNKQKREEFITVTMYLWLCLSQKMSSFKSNSHKTCKMKRMTVRIALSHLLCLRIQNTTLQMNRATIIIPYLEYHKVGSLKSLTITLDSTKRKGFISKLDPTFCQVTSWLSFNQSQSVVVPRL